MIPTAQVEIFSSLIAVFPLFVPASPPFVTYGVAMQLGRLFY